MAPADSPSASQVNKAGSYLRKDARGAINLSRDDYLACIDVINKWRAAHAAALAGANMGLRSVVRTTHCDSPEISQRLKRLPTILDKLINREPTLALSRMQDIGGVRAVLASIEEVRRVEARVRKNRSPLVSYADYIAQPRESGYRGLHLVVNYSGRNIEIQLRTQVMHVWAITVEEFSARAGRNLKQDGNHAVQEFMKVVSRAMAIEEAGGTVDPALLTELTRLRAAALPYLRSSPKGQ
jgi:ppGpp synthetase/RelA/SpoT-type nucleotidyltranferase